MAEYLAVSKVKDLLAECPICSEHFNNDSRIPRRMPCCIQSICQPCLETYIRGNKDFSCPLCRQKHHLSGGVRSLPKEVIILRMLEHLKIEKGLQLPCTDCPENETASSGCEDCGAYLCRECLRAHCRHISTRHHKTVSLDEMKHRPVEGFHRQHHCKDHNQPQQFYCKTCKKVICFGCTVVDHKVGSQHDIISIAEAHSIFVSQSDEMLAELELKSSHVGEIVKELKQKTKRFRKSKQIATDIINTSFSQLTEIMQQRREHLLADLEHRFNGYFKETEKILEEYSTLLWRMKTTAGYTKELRGKADKIDDLEITTSSNKTIRDLIKASTGTVEMLRKGVTFAPVNITTLQAAIKVTGLVKLVEYSPGGGTGVMDDEETPTKDRMLLTSQPTQDDDLSAKEYIFCYVPDNTEGQGHSITVLCPNLEFDEATAHSEVTVVSPTSISNNRSVPHPPETGCRMQAWRRAMTAKPLIIREGQHILFQADISFSLKTKRPENLIIFECALTQTPVDIFGKQPSGLSVIVQSCSTHRQLCLIAEMDGRKLSDEPIMKIRNGLSRTMKLCFLLDSCKGTVQVYDVELVSLVCSFIGIKFEHPLWLMVYVGLTRTSELTCQLHTGKQLNLTDNIKTLLCKTLVQK